MIGSKVNEHPELTRRILAEGHELGVHTFTHVELAAVPEWRRDLELTLCQNAIAGVTGFQSALMRPPYSSEPDAVSADEFDAIADVAAGQVPRRAHRPRHQGLEQPGREGHRRRGHAGAGPRARS